MIRAVVFDLEGTVVDLEQQFCHQAGTGGWRVCRFSHPSAGVSASSGQDESPSASATRSARAPAIDRRRSALISYL